MQLGKWYPAIVLSLLLSGCAVGYANEQRAVGVAIGDAEVSSCAQAEQKGLAGVVGAAREATPENVPDCPRVKGGTVSVTGGGILTSIVSYAVGWIMR